MKHYNLREEDTYDLSFDPSLKEVNDTMKEIRLRIHKGRDSVPKINYIIIFLFAGHGLLKEGEQVIVINEYDRSNGFYKLFMAESKLRDLAERYSNAYLIGIFACCR